MELRHVLQSALRSTSTLPSRPASGWHTLPNAAAASAAARRRISTGRLLLAPPRSPLPPTRAAAPPNRAPPPSVEGEIFVTGGSPQWPAPRQGEAKPPASPQELGESFKSFQSDPPRFDSLVPRNIYDSQLLWESMKPKEAPMRLAPELGRTVYVSGGVDQARAFQLLNALCRRNQVAALFARQRFHERPGKKRKRLRSERWRKRFREGFLATTKRVRELAKQGW